MRSVRLGLGSLRLGLGGGYGSSAVPFDPATLALTGWWRASYGGAPWAAAGGTVAGDMVAPTTAPAVGAAVNGFTPTDNDQYNTGNQYLREVTNYIEDYVSITGLSPGPGFSYWCLFNTRTLTADNANPYDNPGLVSTNAGGYVLCGVSDAGLRVAVYDGAYKQLTIAGVSVGTWYMAHVVHDGTSLKAGLNDGALSSVAASLPANPGATSYRLQLCTNYSAANEVDGMILDVGFCKTILSDTDRANLTAYARARYALSLT